MAKKTIRYLGAKYVLVEGGQLRLVKKFQGDILPALKGTRVARNREFTLFKFESGFQVVHEPTKFRLTYVPFGHGIGQSSSEPDPGYTVTEDEALMRAQEILAYYAKNFGGMKTSISEVRGSLRQQGHNYLSFLSAN